MSISTFFTAKISKWIIHLIVLIIAYKFLVHTSYRFQASRTLGISDNATYVLFFYIHLLLLLPILIEKKNLKKYLISIIACYILANVAHAWFNAAHSGKIIMNDDGTFVNPLHFFLRKDWIVGKVISSFPSYITIAILSFICYLLIYNLKKVLPYLEVIINLITISIIYKLIDLSVKTGSSGVLLFLVILAIFYINTFLITPVLILEKKKLKYIFLLILGLIASYLLIQVILKIVNFSPAVGYPFNNKHESILIATIIISVTFLLSFVYGYVRIKTKLKDQAFNLKLGAKESELQLLKSQVNPHFLFNTLNTLYATALEEKAPKTAESTAKLASLIRYMQEDINKDFIPLENEIKYLEDYILIQKLRCAVEPEIETDFKNIENHHISPGLLIPFVENAFKYGINPSKKSNLKVSVICSENTINFECINSYDESFSTYYKEQGFGIGIKNAKQRLELVYPKNHTFEVKKENNVFLVTINITVKN